MYKYRHASQLNAEFVISFISPSDVESSANAHDLKRAKKRIIKKKNIKMDIKKRYKKATISVNR